MKKQLIVFVILLTLVSSFLNFSNIMSLPTVGATYVEGAVTKNTVWTLVDSPFMLSGDVTVSSNATLTIEPGVEVKFGEGFSLVIDGRLVANGTESKMIRFTSNKDEAEVGDWKTIQFLGTGYSSLEYCIVEYGTNGTTVENGYLTIHNSLITHNSENGIVAIGGNVVISNNTISDNTLDGIYIADSSVVTMRNNIIRSNQDGLSFTGSLTGAIDVEQNEILSNSHGGVLLAATAYASTNIVNNVLSSNIYGFYISTSTSTYITGNYVLNNSIGILYEQGGNHAANFNDVCDNTVGMDVSGSATVNATRNYWGEKSGPYHESLNPRGKGNPVGGDGINLDFIFFLTAPIDYENTPPTAVLFTDKILVAPNQNVTFIGTDSYDDGRVDKYLFDFGDGYTSDWTTLTLLTHNYSSTGTYNARLKVVDDFGVQSDYDVETVEVQNLSPLDVSVVLSSYSVDCNTNVTVTVYVSDGANPVENATVTLFSLRGGSSSPSSGLTDATGYFTTTFTAPSVVEIVNSRLIARASKTGYADGSDYKYLKVFPPLTVEVTADPPTVKSEATATVAVHVTSGLEEDVEDALLTLSSDVGSLSVDIGTTNTDGLASFVFTAPQTTEPLNATITVTATKIGFVSAQGQTIIVLMPKILDVQVTASNNVTISEGRVDVVVHVTYETVPISGANVTIVSEGGGNLSATTQLSDSYGDCNLVFTAPQVNAPFTVVLGAQASKASYATGEGSLNIDVYPGTLEVEIAPVVSSVKSGETAVVAVLVKCNGTAVVDAQITVSTDIGNFSGTTGVSDANGSCTFMFNAPSTEMQLQSLLRANVTKNGFISAENETTITITPETITEGGGGWSLTTILLIVIPIVILVIVVVLIKMKVIVVSSKEEEE